MIFMSQLWFYKGFVSKNFAFSASFLFEITKKKKQMAFAFKNPPNFLIATKITIIKDYFVSELFSHSKSIICKLFL